ncbi:MAG: DUF1269 domain-containing protein [Sandaracinaceae bacterium]
MSHLIAIAFPGEPERASELRQRFVGMSQAHLVDLYDAVVVRRTAEGKIRLDQIHDLTGRGAVSGAFWGLLIGFIFSLPLVGPGALFLPFITAGVGAGTGALGGKMTDIGINDDFINRVSEALTPGSSALFVLVRENTPDKVLEQLEGVGGTVLTTNLSHEGEARLQSALRPLREQADTFDRA